MPTAVDRKISEENATTTLANTDELVVSDVSASTSGTAKRIDVVRFQRYHYTFLPFITAANNQTISSGAITLVRSQTVVNPESGAADDLATINGANQYDIVCLRPSTGDTITVKHAAGNIYLNGSADKTLDQARDFLVLFNYDGSNWIQLMFSNNG
jgi:hypothetical protein